MRFLASHRRAGTSGGFSLIELMVSVALFAVVMTLSVGTLLTLIDANRKAQSLKSVINNLNFGVDSITRNLRTGDTFYCDDDVSTMPEGTQECPDGATGITFTADTGALVGYQYTESTIERRIVDGEDDSGWISLTAPEVVIDDMLFYVSGAAEDDDVQPTVTLSIRGTAGVNTEVDSSFNVQTTVAQRILTESILGAGGGGGGVNYELFASTGTFTAPAAGTYRIFAVGGGGGGGADEGAGGGSGYVAYTTASLTEGQEVAVSIGAGGASSSGGGSSGSSSTFGGYLTASGGSGGGYNNTAGGAGGSGGAGDPNSSGQSQVGGSAGSAGTNTGAGGGSGQGASFTANYGSITEVTLTSGSGGSTLIGNGYGGGGGGGVVVDGDTSIKADNNPLNTANGGIGYGAGGAGGQGHGGSRVSGAGRAGMVVVEWD